MQEQLEKSQAKYKARHDKHPVDHNFQVGDQVWLYISKERMKDEGKKLNPIKYGAFFILEKIGNNAFRLDLPPYMQMYYVFNVEKLKLHEPMMIVDRKEDAQIPFVDYFSPKYLNELQEDVVLDKKVRSLKEVFLNIFEWDSKECIQTKKDGWKLEELGNSSLTYLLNKN